MRRAIEVEYLARCVRLYELALVHDLFADLDAGTTAAELRAHHVKLEREEK